MLTELAKLILFVTIAGVGIALSLYVLQRLDPVRYRRRVFQPIRELLFFLDELDAWSHWRDIEHLRLREPEVFRIPASEAGSVTIVATLYRPAGTRQEGTVVLQHGSYPWGRKGALIRLLATRLSEDGWLVVAPDSRGFGDSETPPDVEDPQAWRTASDLKRVIDYVIPSAPSENLCVLGHSMGANHTLEGGLADERVKALLLVGPGRYPEREDVLMPDWERARFSADRKLDTLISRETALFFFSLGNIRLMAHSELATPNHKPILLIDGEKEGPGKLEYLRDVLRGIEGPVEYHTLPDAGHYCGVRSFFGSEHVYYRPDLFEPFYGIVADFLTRQNAASAARRTSSYPETAAPGCGEAN